MATELKAKRYVVISKLSSYYDIYFRNEWDGDRFVREFYNYFVSYNPHMDSDCFNISPLYDEKEVLNLINSTFQEE